MEVFRLRATLYAWDSKNGPVGAVSDEAIGREPRFPYDGFWLSDLELERTPYSIYRVWVDEGPLCWMDVPQTYEMQAIRHMVDCYGASFFERYDLF